MNAIIQLPRIPEGFVDVVEPGQRARRGHNKLAIDRDVRFRTSVLESYFFATWEPLIVDAMLVAAAIEYADKLIRRSALCWTRKLTLRVPVYDPSRWKSPVVSLTLHEAIQFLTGDDWTLEFVQRAGRPIEFGQKPLELTGGTDAVIAFSDGMDSRAVAGIVAREVGDKVVRVRLGPQKGGSPKSQGKREPFVAVPYDVVSTMPNRETTARSRGFKFTLIAGLAAYLAKASEVVMTESGQGALGPALLHVGHIYPDYRNHPLFTQRMERFLRALLGKSIRYTFPRIWHTKGTTLQAFAAFDEKEEWRRTRSCWRSNRWASIDHKTRQCGVCAACMLRRMSVHAAGLTEAKEVYIAEDLSTASLEEAVNPKFTKLTRAYREYAIAGILHMDHLAELTAPRAKPSLRAHAAQLGPALRISAGEAEEKLQELVGRHAQEWAGYVQSLGEHSFVRHWTRTRS